jgi:hypothetical protein
MVLSFLFSVFQFSVILGVVLTLFVVAMNVLDFLVTNGTKFAVVFISIIVRLFIGDNNEEKDSQKQTGNYCKKVPVAARVPARSATRRTSKWGRHCGDEERRDPTDRG